jgi:enoyl-CoA hydratase/carnithine racemase
VGEFVTVTTDDEGVATLRLDRAPVNALNSQVWVEFSDAARQISGDDSIAAVVLWGGPKVFAAGADIKEMQTKPFQEFFARAGVLQEAFNELARMPQITIAAINGYALGGGCELSLTADFRYAAEAGGTQRMARLIGVQKTKEMVYEGRMYGAQECLEMGLVDKVFPAEEVYDKAVEAARRYAKGPYALRMAKKSINEGIEMGIDEALRLETTLFTACFATEDRQIGMDSFLAEGPGKAKFVRR